MTTLTPRFIGMVTIRSMSDGDTKQEQVESVGADRDTNNVEMSFFDLIDPIEYQRFLNNYDVLLL